MTPQQAQAVREHGRNLIVVAGAGSGKTRVLVERYLALLDRNPEWPLNALVAITFTRKAAQEMRDRVRQALEERLRSATDSTTRAVWAARLASMDSARIDTIHGLCATLLRANAAEAGLDPDFTVLDEVEAGIVLDGALDIALQTVRCDPTSKAVRLFAEYDARALRAALTDFIAADLPPLSADPLSAWRTAWEADAAAALDALCADPAFAQVANWQPSGGWPQTPDKLLSVWDEARRLCGLIQTGDTTTRADALIKLKLAVRLNVGSKSAWGGEDALAEAKAVLGVLRNLAEQTASAIGEPPGPLDDQAAALLPAWRDLIERAQAAYCAAKRRLRALDFEDLERLTANLLTSHPTVAARYRAAEFRHLLVDEFQDTNAAQWTIISALADPDRPGGLFLVGDQKQSIYAFRGADVSVFQAVRARLGPQAEIALTRSFRTHQPLVTAFNALFSRILGCDPASPIRDYQTDLGAPMDAARTEPPGPGPFVELLLVDRSADNDQSNADDARRWEAYEIARRIHALVQAETPVYDRHSGQVRPLDYGDVALLFQSLSKVTVYEEVFRALGLPFLTVSGRGYYGRQEVWDLLNLLRALYNPADDLALACALRAPLFGLSDDALLALRLLTGADGQPLPLWDALQQPDVVPPDERELVRFAADCLRDLRALAGRVAIAELLRAALDRTGFLAVLTGLPDGARRRANVEKLLAKAETSGRITLGAFTQYIADLSAREVREGEAPLETQGAVTLMTVHTSKGLEFPLVVLADTGWERKNAGKPLLIADRTGALACRVYDWNKNELADTCAYRRAARLRALREEAERRRLLYVAVTRAQDYLLISGQVGQNQKDGGWQAGGWLSWLLNALEAWDDLNHADSGGVVLARAWGECRLRVAAAAPSPDELFASGADSPCAWDDPAVRASELLPDPPAPPLLATVPDQRAARARHLAVTHLMDLGGAEYDEACRRRFRRSVLHDAPDHVQPAAYRRSYGRLVGEIVHEALRWQWSARTDRNVLLHDLAWERGVVDELERERVVAQAARLLTELQHSEVFAWRQHARQSYTELPFIYSRGDRILHGVVDLLLQRADGTWVIVDYKTAYVPNIPLREHAQRYHLQVGAYAEALTAHLVLAGLMRPGAAPEVYIHYLRHAQTVAVTPDEWRAALAALEQQIDKALT